MCSVPRPSSRTPPLSTGVWGWRGGCFMMVTQILQTHVPGPITSFYPQHHTSMGTYMHMNCVWFICLCCVREHHNDHKLKHSTFIAWTTLSPKMHVLCRELNIMLYRSSSNVKNCWKTGKLPAKIIMCNGLELCSCRISCFHAFWCFPRPIYI